MGVKSGRRDEANAPARVARDSKARHDGRRARGLLAPLTFVLSSTAEASLHGRHKTLRRQDADSTKRVGQRELVIPDKAALVRITDLPGRYAQLSTACRACEVPEHDAHASQCLQRG
mmetsp:Transcript_68428/g.152734  ORF Transcript_68428/g.152734 Transcript_68428/m.152734 type:complete len:117 (+) Transcript_68428:618-968(+)